MSDCLLLLYWPDFAAEVFPHTPIHPSLLACLVHRQLGRRYGHGEAYVCTPNHLPVATRTLFRRWGFHELESPALDPGKNPDPLLDVVDRHPTATHVVLAMAPDRAAPLAAQLQDQGRSVSIWTPNHWTPQPTSPATLPAEDVPTVRLSQALNYATARSVGLFVDWPSVILACQRLGIPTDNGAVLLGLLRHAEVLGSVVTARVYGYYPDGSELELAGNDPVSALNTPERPETAKTCRSAGHSPRDTMRADLLRLLDSPEAPSEWVLVSHGEWLLPLIQRARQADHRVALWAPEPSELSNETRAAADTDATLASVLCLDSPIPLRAAVLPDAGQISLDGVPAPEIAAAPNPARLGPWTRLIYQIECLLRQNQWTRIPFRKLAHVLAEIEEFGPTPTNAALWINHAKVEGMLLAEQDFQRGDATLRVTMYRPNGDHPATRAALDVPDRCLRLLHQMLQKIPWVSFKLLRSVLLREQWLGGAPYHLDEIGIDEWLNFLIREGAICMTKEPNLVNPDYPVTALRLNEEHPLSQAVITEATEGVRLAAERAILVVDHFLTRNRKPWMAMGALRRALGHLSREELQSVLQGLQNLGALVTESYPNPQKEHFTTGCHLQREQSLVRDALGIRDTIIRVTQHQQRFRSWVPLAQVDHQLASECPSAPSRLHRLAWYLLLRDEGILEFDYEGLLPSAGWETLSCRLNLSDAVVRSVVAQRAPTRIQAHVTEAAGPRAGTAVVSGEIEVRVSEYESANPCASVSSAPSSP